MRIVVGLGNPGKEYQRTRHNVGFMLVDEVARRHEIQCSRHRFRSLVGSGRVAGERLVLVKPQTYMNLSGAAVAEVVQWYECELPDLVVACDDFHLALGQIRIRKKGSAGGHNGLTAIIEALGTNEFPRMRLGIGVSDRRHNKDFVLSTFESEEMDAVKEMVDRAADAADVWLKDGANRAMEIYNARPRREDEQGKEEDGH